VHLLAFPNLELLLQIPTIHCASLKTFFSRELLSIFDQAQESDAMGGSADWASMKKCADTLRFLNGGTSVIQHFVCSRPCFFDVTTFERDDELIKSANSMEASEGF
jgi:hypothetical protein